MYNRVFLILGWVVIFSSPFIGMALLQHQIVGPDGDVVVPLELVGIACICSRKR